MFSSHRPYPTYRPYDEADIDNRIERIWFQSNKTGAGAVSPDIYLAKWERKSPDETGSLVFKRSEAQQKIPPTPLPVVECLEH
jgi:hypothetical protein